MLTLKEIKLKKDFFYFDL